MLARSDIQTPRTHGEVLVAPTASKQKEALRAALPEGTLLGRPLHEIRSMLWAELNLTGPVVVTGHQAEFVHAGVFAKTIATSLLADGGSSVYLTVDSDTPKTSVLAIPTIVSGEVRQQRQLLPDLDLQKPLECQVRPDRDRWRAWFDEVRRQSDTADDWFDTFVDGWLRSDGNLADAFIAGQQACEARLGIQHLHLKTSTLAATPAFRAYLLDIAQRAETFVECYNAAQLAYRQRHGVRTAQRPVPQLQATASELELPFWAVQAQGTRHRLGLRRADRQLLADGQPIGTLPSADWDAAQVATESERNGWQFRPRALTLSGFCRLVLGHVFVHGIGGAKYDELTDDFTAAFWGATPAPLACVSAAVLLDLPYDAEADERLRSARYAARDVHFNPQRQLQAPEADLVKEKQRLVEEGRHLRESERHDRTRRLANHRALQEVNTQLLTRHADQLPGFAARVQDAQTALTHAAVARNREYFHGLLPTASIEALRDRLAAAYG